MCGKLPHVETLSSPYNYSFTYEGQLMQSVAVPLILCMCVCIGVVAYT